jgi:cob(I)alamin adenosyltransferase
MSAGETGTPYDNSRDDATRGYVQVYTGDGKGKTTAAIGLAMRALGAGMSVFFAQFIKAGRYSEIKTLEGMKNLTYRQYGSGRFITGAPTDDDILAAKAALNDVRAEMLSGRYQVVILDEANVAYSLGLLAEEDLLALADERPETVELVFTGRGAPEKLMEKADLVTEMREIKHYYAKGVKARRGIES